MPFDDAMLKSSWLCFLGGYTLEWCGYWLPDGEKGRPGLFELRPRDCLEKGTTRDEWRRIVDTATLQWSMLWKKHIWCVNVQFRVYLPVVVWRALWI